MTNSSPTYFKDPLCWIRYGGNQLEDEIHTISRAQSSPKSIRGFANIEKKDIARKKNLLIIVCAKGPSWRHSLDLKLMPHKSVVWHAL